LKGISVVASYHSFQGIQRIGFIDLFVMAHSQHAGKTNRYTGLVA
jgi:hypothetical protein